MRTRTRSADVCTRSWEHSSGPPDFWENDSLDTGAHAAALPPPPRTRAAGSKKNKSQPERCDLQKTYNWKPLESKPNGIKNYKLPVPVPRTPYPFLYPVHGRQNRTRLVTFATFLESIQTATNN